MLCEVPLTKEQQEFAAEHHGLVYKFRFQPTPPFERRHIRKIERRGKDQPL